MVEYIIDGCNVVKSTAAGAESGFEARKNDLVARLISYAGGRGVAVTVVFDSRRPSVEKMDGVRVLHTRDADSRIADEVRRRRAPRSVTVVSDDRALIREVRDAGARHMPVAEFERFLAKKLGTPQSRRDEDQAADKPRPGRMSPEQVRRWKKELGL